MKEKKSIAVFLMVLFLIAAGNLEAKKIKKMVLPSTIADLKNSFKPDKKDKILINAALTNNLSEIAVNYEVIKNHNDFYTYEITTGNATNQKQSGRCWLFSGLNILRPAVMKKLGIYNFEFSQLYLDFWDKIEKSNFFLERAIELADVDVRDSRYQSLLNNPIVDGGWWNYFVNLVEKYGAVPKSAMPETVSSENPAIMVDNVNQRLKLAALAIKDAKQKGKSDSKLREIKKEELKKIYKMLVFHLGIPPEKFEFRYKAKQNEIKTYTPVEFAKEYISDDLNNYVVLANYSSRQINTLYVMNPDTENNMIGGKNTVFLNVDLNDMKQAVLRSVLTDSPVWFGASMAYNIDYVKGIMHADLYEYGDIYGVNLKTDKATASLIKSLIVTHVMAIVGVDIKDGEIIKWKVENSWGNTYGKNGFYAMYDNWFNNYVFQVVVKKQYLKTEMLEYLKQEPTVIKWNEPVP